MIDAACSKLSCVTTFDTTRKDQPTIHPMQKSLSDNNRLNAIADRLNTILLINKLLVEETR